MASWMLVLGLIAMLSSLLPMCGCWECFAQDSVYLSASELTVENLEEALKNVTISPEFACEFYLEFDYRSRSFTLTFPTSMGFRRRTATENTGIQISTTIGLDPSTQKPDQTFIKTKVGIICYSHNACDRELIVVHFEWLTSANYTELELAIRPRILLANTKKSKSYPLQTNTNLVKH
jgi:hypothetical protein